MSNLFNLIIGGLIFLFFIAVGWGFLKPSDFVNQQTAKAKSGIQNIAQSGQNITDIPRRTKAYVEEEVIAPITDQTSKASTDPAVTSAENPSTPADAPADYEAAAQPISSTSNTIEKDKATTPQKTVAATNTTADSPTAEAPKPSASNQETAPYMIITGSFSQAANANKELKKLHQLGYPNAKSVYLGTTQYKSVVAGYYNSLSDAQATKQQLHQQGIKEAYVHQRRVQQ